MEGQVSKISRFGIQRKIVANMTSESWQNIPHVSYIYEPDVTEFIKKYKAFDAALPEGKHVTLNTVILKAITEAIKAAPQMNAHIHFERKLVRGKIIMAMADLRRTGDDPEILQILRRAQLIIEKKIFDAEFTNKIEQYKNLIV